MDMSLVAVILFWAPFALAQDHVSQPELQQNYAIATKLKCQTDELQHFVYTSNTELWGMQGGRISLSADVSLLCLGDDKDGSFGSEALKYRVGISNLQIDEVKERVQHAVIREKRGARDFFTKQWGKIKQFFRRVFRKNEGDARVLTNPAGGTVDDDTESSPEQEFFEDFNGADFATLYSAPFQFVQLSDGSIPELRFAENEEDMRVRNFKRHLVDAFSTQLDVSNRRHTKVEESVLGEHTSSYNITFNQQVANLNSDGKNDVKPSVTVKKVVTEDDVVKLAPSEALNHRDQMDLKLEQVQVFEEGQMVSSSGTHSLTLLAEAGGKNSRVRREEGFDVASLMQIQTTFQIQLQKRKRRSTSVQELDHETSESFFPASRVAEFEGTLTKAKRRFLAESAEDHLFENLIKLNENEYDEKLQALFEVVEGEVSMGLDKDSNSVSALAMQYFSKEAMHSLCEKNFTICKDFLQLLAMIGGSQVEDIFLSFLLGEHSMSSMEVRIVTDLASDVSKPSGNFLYSLSQMLVSDSVEKDVLGTLCITLGHLASKATSQDLSRISEIFINLLKRNMEECGSSTFLVDILEAIGNLRSTLVVPNVLEVAESCKDSEVIQIASIHALRHSTHLNSVQHWMQDNIAMGNCNILSAIVGSLLDKIQDQEITPGDTHWPRFGTNDVDRLLKDHLTNFRCFYEDIIKYFQRKRDPEANDLARTHFGPESGPWDPQSRQRRSLLDDLNCRKWSEDDARFVVIQDREEFAADRANYNNRRSCLGSKRLGVKGINAEIYAGMFAGVKEPSDPPKYKLFTKFVSQLNFLGQHMEIGSFRFYQQNGRMNTYVKILGRTRQEFSHEGCTPADLMYRPLRHLPLFMLNVGIAQLSLGVQVSSQLGMNTQCEREGNVFVLSPIAGVRVGGSATGTVLFVRGGINLGGNFNYKLQLTFTPSPNMCLKGSHGHDPMNVGFETYYQLWNKPKDDWGKMRTWKPGFVTWNLTKSLETPWFDDTCIVKGRSGSNTERELE